MASEHGYQIGNKMPCFKNQDDPKSRMQRAFGREIHRNSMDMNANKISSVLGSLLETGLESTKNSSYRMLHEKRSSYGGSLIRNTQHASFSRNPTKPGSNISGINLGFKRDDQTNKSSLESGRPRTDEHNKENIPKPVKDMKRAPVLQEKNMNSQIIDSLNNGVEKSAIFSVPHPSSLALKDLQASETEALGPETEFFEKAYTENIQFVTIHDAEIMKHVKKTEVLFGMTV
jgi:hypothetical protein